MSQAPATEKSALESLKDYSAIIVGVGTLLYVWGYLIFTVYFRLLGVEISGQPLDYIKLAADYCTSIFISVLQLSKPSAVSQYLPKLADGKLVNTMGGCFLVGFLLALARSLKTRRIEAPLKVAVLPCLIGAFGFLLYFEMDVLAVKNILQPFNPDEIQILQPRSKQSQSLDERSSLVKEVYDDYSSLNANRPDYDKWANWFSPTTKYTASQERLATYLALVLVNLLLFAAGVVVLFICRADSWPLSGLTRFIMIVMLLAQMFLFPAMYATLGRNFTFPVVSLSVSTQNNEGKAEGPSQAGRPIKTHCVYLIAQNDNEIVVYDRLDLFSIKHVPKSKIIQITERFKASPFEGCQHVQGQFTPCEVLWAPESGSVSDF